MLEAKAFLLSPADLGGVISLKHTKQTKGAHAERRGPPWSVYLTSMGEAEQTAGRGLQKNFFCSTMPHCGQVAVNCRALMLQTPAQSRCLFCRYRNFRTAPQRTAQPARVPAVFMELLEYEPAFPEGSEQKVSFLAPIFQPKARYVQIKPLCFLDAEHSQLRYHGIISHVPSFWDRRSAQLFRRPGRLFLRLPALPVHIRRALIAGDVCTEGVCRQRHQRVYAAIDIRGAVVI